MSTLIIIILWILYSLIGAGVFKLLLLLDVDSNIILIPMFILCGPIIWITGICFILAMLNEHIKMKKREKIKHKYN